MYKYKKIVVGIDQSYEDSGITIAADGKALKIGDLKGKYNWTKTEYRKRMGKLVKTILEKNKGKAEKLVVHVEQIRLNSAGFISIDYIKSMAALNAVIVDTAIEQGVKTYSIDTRSWKANVVGTSKPKKNKWGISPKKWPTIQWAIEQGYEEEIKEEVSEKKKNGVVTNKNGERFTYNDNKADSIGIALYGFIPKSKQRLKLEK